MHGADERRWGKAKLLKAGGFVRKLREDNHLTPKQLCNEISMTLSQLSDIERGIQALSLRRAQQLAKLFPQATSVLLTAVLQDRLDDAGFSNMRVAVFVGDSEESRANETSTSVDSGEPRAAGGSGDPKW